MIPNQRGLLDQSLTPLWLMSCGRSLCHLKASLLHPAHLQGWPARNHPCPPGIIPFVWVEDGEILMPDTPLVSAWRGLWFVTKSPMHLAGQSVPVGCQLQHWPCLKQVPLSQPAVLWALRAGSRAAVVCNTGGTSVCCVLGGTASASAFQAGHQCSCAVQHCSQRGSSDCNELDHQFD